MSAQADWITAFAAPHWLWALLLVALLPRSRLGLVRSVGFAALVIALAQPVTSDADEARAVVVDLSASVDGEALVPSIDAWTSEWAGGAAVDTWGFASDVTRLDDGSTLPTSLDRSTTDVVRALTVVAGTDVDRILLVSDGRFDPSDVTSARLPIPVDVVHVDSAANVGIADVRLPRTHVPGTPIVIEVDVSADVATTARLTIAVDGVAETEVDLDVSPGTTTVRDVVTIDGGTEAEDAARDSVVDVTIVPDLRQPTVDDTVRTTSTSDAGGAIWVIGDDAMAARLERLGFLAVSRAPTDVRAPITASAIVLREPAASFTTSQLEQLGDWVEAGGGLWMTGGPTSFGLGGWQRTTVDALLPVDSDVPDEAFLPLVGLVLVLDVSQSMDVGSPTKISLARRGAAEVVELAYERDLLGLVAFSDVSRWAFTLRPATSRGKLEMAQAIANLTAGGGTVLRPALDMAVDALATSDAVVRHVIVLSDGRLSGTNDPFGASSDDLLDVAGRAATERITVSTIALGDDADVASLRRLAVATGGRSIVVDDAASLPRAFASEAFAASRPLLREGPATATVDPHPLVAGLDGVPSVDAYVATRLKPDAEEVFGFTAPESLLSVRRVGLGRTAALTTDLSAWSGVWGASADADAVVARLAGWLSARPDRYGSDLTTERGSVVLTVDAVEGGAFLRGASLTARAAGRTTALLEVGPGRYAADLGAIAPGTTVVVSEGVDVVARARYDGASLEFAPRDGETVLARIASATGGVRWNAGDGPVVGTSRDDQTARRWPWLLVTAVALAVAWSSDVVRSWWSRRGRTPRTGAQSTAR